MPKLLKQFSNCFLLQEKKETKIRKKEAISFVFALFLLLQFLFTVNVSECAEQNMKYFCTYLSNPTDLLLSNCMITHIFLHHRCVCTFLLSSGPFPCSCDDEVTERRGGGPEWYLYTNTEGSCATKKSFLKDDKSCSAWIFVLNSHRVLWCVCGHDSVSSLVEFTDRTPRCASTDISCLEKSLFRGNDGISVSKRWMFELQHNWGLISKWRVIQRSEHLQLRQKIMQDAFEDSLPYSCL